VVKNLHMCFFLYPLYQLFIKKDCNVNSYNPFLFTSASWIGKLFQYTLITKALFFLMLPSEFYQIDTLSSGAINIGDSGVTFHASYQALM
jgi:hypothetical protein